MPKKESFAEFAAHFERPTQTPRIMLEGNHEAVIEGYQHILTYQDCMLHVALRNIGVKLHGVDLHIRSFSKDVLVITGTITGIEYLGLEEIP